jgi:hypothetical protein
MRKSPKSVTTTHVQRRRDRNRGGAWTALSGGAVESVGEAPAGRCRRHERQDQNASASCPSHASQLASCLPIERATTGKRRQRIIEPCVGRETGTMLWIRA